MTALTNARSLIEADGIYSEVPMKGATTILQGALVVTASNLAVPGKTATALTAIGIARQTVVNGGGDGEASIPIKRGTFKFFNLAADEIPAGAEGKDCYVVDDQTVAMTDGTGTRSKAGKIIQVEADGVFVRVGY